MLGRRIVSTAYFALITRTGTTTTHAFSSLSSSSSTSTLSALVHTSSSSSSSFRMDTNNYSLFGRRTKNIGSSVSVSARIRSSSPFSGSSSSSLGASSESDCTNNLETTTTTSTTTTSSSSSSSSELPEYDESIETTTTSSTPIFDTTLVSIQQCITAYNQQQQQQQQKQGGAPSSKIVFIDGSWYHKPNPITNKFRNPTREFQIGPRLPSARYLNIDELATTSTLFPNNDNDNDNDNANNNPRKNPTTTTGAGGLQLQLQLPHMMPPPHLFGLSMDAYNIRKEDTVVVYGRRGALFTPRVWFLFVCMGHEEGKVHLLQGSLEDYVEEGGVVELDSLLADTTTMDGDDDGDDVDDGDGDDDDDNRQNDGNDDRYDYYASMGEGYTDCFDEGVLNVTRLYHRHYSTTIPEYKMDVISAMNICGKEEVLDAVNQYLNDAGADADDDDDDDDDDDGDSTTTTTTTTADTNSTNTSTSRRFEKTIILDTRGSGYAKNGHMPSAIHLPYTSIATPTNSLKIRSKFELEKLFEERVAGVDVLDPELKIILSCGSGVSVCHGYLALKELGRNITEENTRIYDGSWKEWGKDEDLPKIFPGEE